MRAIVVERSVNLATPVERVWPLVTETDRFNRLIGMNEVHFRAIEEGAKGAARFVAETRSSGFKLVYEEEPFEWSHERAWGVTRRMRGGLVESYRIRLALERTKAGDGTLENGTKLTVRMEIKPRSWIGAPVAWMAARGFTSKFENLGRQIDAHVIDGGPGPYIEPVSEADPVRLASSVDALKRAGVDDKLADRIGELVLRGPDADVVRMRPFAVADDWNEDRREVLRTFLRAVPAGLVELRWGIVCPSCLTSSQQARALDEVPKEGHCQLCDVTFDLDLDRAVEATFLPHPAVRRVPDAMFCIGGPGRTPHVLVQSTLDAGATRDLDVPSKAGRYRIFARGGATASLEVDEGAPVEAECTVTPDAVQPGVVRVAPGGTLTVTSGCPDARHVKIERLEFASAAATAHIVSTLAEFRTLFSSDLLKRGTPLKVARTAVLFSDLTGSTALYTTVGDAAAFRLVDDHFDLLREVVDAHQGVVVKTMGDAVMASFVDAHECARAAVDALEKFEAFRAAHAHGEHVGLKLGMFAGACYVVTANGALDYFGQTVNVASRVQHLAGSGELVLAADVLESMDEATRGRLAVHERFEATVKGVREPLSLVRLRLAPAAVNRSTSSRPAAAAPSPRA